MLLTTLNSQPANPTHGGTAASQPSSTTKQNKNMDVIPLHQNIDKVFSNTIYYIDFYQRDYKWNKEPVERLLDDIFYKFNQEYSTHSHLDSNKETVNEKYPWYYLNTFVTNTISGQTYVVDGQQRLTTLALILIKIRHLAKKSLPEARIKWIEQKICGYSGDGYEFWMCHEKHKTTLSDLYDGTKALSDISVATGITAVNMVQNFKTISDRLDKELSTDHKLDTFTYFFMYRLVLINLNVAQTDVPMIFEVINDRGVRLKPYEIIKGKLLGQIDKIELNKENFNDLWENKINAINSRYEDMSDEFFRYYLKSKFASSRKDGSKFDGEYHREMFSTEMEGKLNLRYNPVGVKKFLKNEFSYYADLFKDILDFFDSYDGNQKYIWYNRLNEQDGQFLLILSSMALNDRERSEKIKKITYEFDRYYSLLQLQNSYDSNAFADSLFKISNEIREQPLAKYREVFDNQLIEQIKSRLGREVDSPFNYQLFKSVGYTNLNARFLRYFFARIEEFMARETRQEMRATMEDLVTKTGSKNGFHVEHILSYNEENLVNFRNNEDIFEQERNRLGGLLMLKGKDNISSGNEVYNKKLKTYAQTLLWNETLREDSYKSKLDTAIMQKKYNFNLRHLDRFGPEELEYRHRLLFDISSIIWK